MSTVEIIILTISNSAALLIAIFQNSLAKAGDTLVKQAEKIGYLVFGFIWFFSGFIYPWIKLFDTYYTPFNKEWVTHMIFFSLTFFFNVVVLMLFRDAKMN